LKTERTRQYVSISIRGTTQLSDIRWAFESTYKECFECQKHVKYAAKNQWSDIISAMRTM
jgi:hypothetical protein